MAQMTATLSPEELNKAIGAAVALAITPEVAHEVMARAIASLIEVPKEAWIQDKRPKIQIMLSDAIAERAKVMVAELLVMGPLANKLRGMVTDALNDVFIDPVKVNKISTNVSNAIGRALAGD